MNLKVCDAEFSHNSLPFFFSLTLKSAVLLNAIGACFPFAFLPLMLLSAAPLWQRTTADPALTALCVLAFLGQIPFHCCDYCSYCYD